MRVTPVGQYAYQLSRWAVLRPVNCYLVREADGFTLIDTLVPGSALSILAVASQLGARITRIVLTHSHVNHTGSLDALRAELPDAEVLFPADESHKASEIHMLKATKAQHRTHGFFSRRKVRPDSYIRAGERIGFLAVYAAPGHTPSQIAFLDRRDQTLFAGDALSTHRGIAIAGIAWPKFSRSELEIQVLATATQTAYALRELHPARLAVGHGNVIEAPDGALENAIAQAERALPDMPFTRVVAEAERILREAAHHS